MKNSFKDLAMTATIIVGIAAALLFGYNASLASARHRAAEDAKIAALANALHRDICQRLGKPLPGPDHTACMSELEGLRLQHVAWVSIDEDE